MERHVIQYCRIKAVRLTVSFLDPKSYPETTLLDSFAESALSDQGPLRQQGDRSGARAAASVTPSS